MNNIKARSAVLGEDYNLIFNNLMVINFISAIAVNYLSYYSKIISSLAGALVIHQILRLGRFSKVKNINFAQYSIALFSTIIFTIQFIRNSAPAVFLKLILRITALDMPSARTNC